MYRNQLPDSRAALIAKLTTSLGCRVSGRSHDHCRRNASTKDRKTSDQIIRCASTSTGETDRSNRKYAGNSPQATYDEAASTTPLRMMAACYQAQCGLGRSAEKCPVQRMQRQFSRALRPRDAAPGSCE